MNTADDIYLTLEEISEGFYKEKGSKFLAFAQPCHSKAEAKIYLDDFRKSHPNACNVCFAWRFGTYQYEDRYSDDSEPNNSAGKPIFGQLIAANVTNVLIAVVRYYRRVARYNGRSLVPSPSSLRVSSISFSHLIVSSSSSYFHTPWGLTGS